MGGEEDDKKKWVKRYSSDHRILLVGEGDFSFSSSLARSFLSASNIVATSLDSYDILVKKFKEAKSNLEILQKLGASTFHGVNATKMKSHSDLKMQEFDRIIFNFPHAGFYGKENDVLLIKMHMDLVEGFFSNANGMLRASGEVHVTHKTSFPFSEWKIEELARRNFLVLVECVDFKIEDYPGYNNKRGDSKRCDEAFPLRESCTFKFRFSRALKEMSEVNQDIPMHVHHQPTLPHIGHPGTSCFRSDFVDHQPPPRPFHCRTPYYSLTPKFNPTPEIYQRPIISDIYYFANRALAHDRDRYIAEASRRFQQFQGNFDVMHHQDASIQTELSKNVNELKGCTSAPTTFGVRPGSVAHSARSQGSDYGRNMAEESRRYEHFQGFNKKLNELLGYTGQPVRISTRNKSSSAFHRDMYFANQAQRYDYESHMAGASGRSQHSPDNPFRMQHQQASLRHKLPPELNKNIIYVQRKQ